MGLFYRQIGEHGNGGYRVKRSFIRWVARPIWRFRLRQALMIAQMSRQPEVIRSLHSALRENSPKYLYEWRKTMWEVGDAVDDLDDVMEWLREDKHYKQADRIRTIMARLARSVPEHQIEYDDTGKPYLLRDKARKYK
ncbi:MAG: hypothetical protein Q4G26_14790 [Paracoccus sp. (in: a-proteobacteria)]|nr:hypothetical protein [Paracoccus sp. (in: a-proteobacteria)]